MKTLFSISSLVAAGLWNAILPLNAQVNVTQYHNHSSRNGLYIDSAFTQSAAANLTRDLNFDGTIIGNVYAQPLYLDNAPGGRPTIIAVTQSNKVYALDAIDGSIIWWRNVGPAVPGTWASSGHSVSSGDPCTIDGQFCSPDNTNCQAGTLSNADTVYEHTFSYFCAAHSSTGMTGAINVAP